MVSPVNCGAGIKPLPLIPDATQTGLIDPAQTAQGLAGAPSSITPATSPPPSPAQKSTTGVSSFFAWISNCCKTTPADALPRPEAGRPKEGETHISSIGNVEEMPASQQLASRAPAEAALPAVSLFIHMNESPAQTLEATPDTHTITGVQSSDVTSIRASSSDGREITPPHFPILLAKSESEESDEGTEKFIGQMRISVHESVDDGIPGETEAPERASSAAGNEAAVLADLPPPVEESATEEPALQPGNACDLIAETAPAASSTTQEGVAAAESELQQPMPDSISV